MPHKYPPTRDTQFESKPWQELERAHDLLHLALSGALPLLPLPPDKDLAQYMDTVAATLCWVLGHRTSTDNVGDMLEGLELALRKIDISLRYSDEGEPFVKDERLGPHPTGPAEPTNGRGPT